MSAPAAAPRPPSSPEAPWPVRTVSQKILQWVSRLGDVWVEGQVTQVSRRPGAGTVFLTLRDPAADVSMTVTCPPRVLDALGAPLLDGATVVVHARPSYWMGRGTLSLAADEVRPVGVGQLLARLEQLKRVLTQEGLFEPARKRTLPFLPRRVGLVCGRASAAERDVVENARRRWPSVRFEVREVAVQGVNAVTEVGRALAELDGHDEVDVIVVTRGGGSLEDLLPFSNEALVRAVAACRTPVVSAIGHEVDTPLLDLVADARASTPTDAAKRVVPDVREERARVEHARERLLRAVVGGLERERARLDALRSRPVLADPASGLDRREEQVLALRDRARRCTAARLDAAVDDLAHTRARVRALSPLATLERGYAVVQAADGSVLRRPQDAADGAPLRLRLAGGDLAAVARRG
ncbi:exodeoxyribonuclease VII large subunit [Vallicoccus soli]|uniref:Exodeoxyribonuclease 7 large subunit n=1 Tax=Vallicoccus soli TaxID=2339232 RepID=A0A3A3ZMQ9_9ACTN|nr:exodeoxyribonuclease VII large subunit [Vallicoccus soli]RJK97981.1 exodeoxyribonuclease VII large subunit [Vallicoccus soli]